MQGRFVSIESVNSEVRILRGGRGVIILQICSGRRCREAPVDPRDLMRALYEVASDVLGEDFVDMLERARDALWSQLLADRAMVTTALSRGDVNERELESLAARLVKHWDLYKMLEDILALARESSPESICGGKRCIEAAREVSRLMDEILGAKGTLEKFMPWRR